MDELRAHSMRLFLKLIMLVVLIGVAACEKMTSDTDVETYISQLKSGTYDSHDLPAFYHSAISALLEYRNDTTVITNYPHNGISSLWLPECKLGMYVLWTIESIRAVEIDSKYLIGRFPSQNPILSLRDVYDFSLVFDTKSQEVAARAYYDWWNTTMIFKNKMKIDPLENTIYMWH